jgi:hypothetical protein
LHILQFAVISHRYFYCHRFNDAFDVFRSNSISSYRLHFFHVSVFEELSPAREGGALDLSVGGSSPATSVAEGAPTASTSDPQPPPPALPNLQALEEEVRRRQQELETLQQQLQQLRATVAPGAGSSSAGGRVQVDWEELPEALQAVATQW